jgi:hypothetical protein
MVYRGGLQEPDGRLEESTEESTVGPYHAGCRTNAAYSNLAMPEKRLTKIGGEAGRHCGDVVGIGRIGFVAVRGMVRPLRRSRRHYHPRTGDQYDFRKPSEYCRTGGSTASPRALSKGNQCRCGLCVPRMNSPVRLTFVVAATAGRCCDTGAALGEGCLLHGLSSDVPGAGALA